MRYLVMLLLLLACGPEDELPDEYCDWAQICGFVDDTTYSMCLEGIDEAVRDADSRNDVLGCHHCHLREGCRSTGAGGCHEACYMVNWAK